MNDKTILRKSEWTGSNKTNYDLEFFYNNNKNILML